MFLLSKDAEFEYGDYDELIRPRALGYCVRKLYPKAFVSYRGLFFLITGVEETDDSRFPIPEDIYDRLKQKMILSEGRLITVLPENAENVTVKVPSKVHARFYDDEDRQRSGFGLEWFFCHKCGRVTQKFHPTRDVRKCPECGGEMDQAPIFTPRSKIPLERQRRPRDVEREALKCIGHIRWQFICDKCKQEGKQKPFRKLRMLDPAEPINSLTWVCPTHGYDEQKNKMWAPRGRGVTYRPVYPSEGLTKSLTVSDVRELHPEKSECIPKDYWEQFIPMAVDIKYSNQLEVYELTYGFLVGEFPFIFSESLERFIVFGRKFLTQGFVVEFTPQIFKEVEAVVEKKYVGYGEEYTRLKQMVKDERMLRKYVLHTIKHALLAALPRYTGLEPQKFFGSFDVETNKVYIYDSEMGGTGGCKTIKDDVDEFQRYLEFVRSNLIAGCPNECRWACKRCLFIENCGEANKSINRHLVGPVFNVTTSMI